MEPEQERNLLQAKLTAESATSADFLRLAQLQFINPGHDFDALLELLDSALKSAPNDPDLLFWKAKVFFHDYCDPRAAADCLRRVLALDDRRADCWSLLASCYIDQGKGPSEYVDFLRKAVESEPTWITPRLMLAAALRRLGNRDDAQEEVRTAKLFVDSIRDVKDPVERYYESVVTGRLGAQERQFDDVWT